MTRTLRTIKGKAGVLVYAVDGKDVVSFPAWLNNHQIPSLVTAQALYSEPPISKPRIAPLAIIRMSVASQKYYARVDAAAADVITATGPTMDGWLAASDDAANHHWVDVRDVREAVILQQAKEERP